MSNQQTGRYPDQRRSTLTPLAQALDNLFNDETSYLYPTLSDNAVAEIRRHFTIHSPAGNGTTDDAGR